MMPRAFWVMGLLLLISGSALAQERQWTLDASDQDAYLVFGVPESDDVGISMWCPIRQGMVNVFVPEATEALPAGKEVGVLISAGETKAEIKGKTEENQDAGITSVEASIAADDPIFAAMMKADRFHVKVGSEDTIFPLVEADVEGLLALCRK
jgi:hypothetical protein